MTVPQLISEWKKSGFPKLIFKSEGSVEQYLTNDNELRDFDDDDFDPGVDLLGIEVEDANGVSCKVSQLIGNRVVIFVFFRQFGCISCKQTASIWQLHRDFLEEQGILLIGIGNGSGESSAKFKKDSGFPGHIYTDKNRVLYKMFGCRRGLKYCLSLKALNFYKKAVSFGSKSSVSDGDMIQLGGTIMYGHHCGIIFHHIEKYLGHTVDINDVTTSIWKYQRDYPDRTWSTPPNLDVGIFTTNTNENEGSQPYHWERGHTFANHENRVLSFAFYKNIIANRDHQVWVRKLPADYSVNNQDDEIGPVVIALMVEKNEDRSALIFHQSHTTRRLAYSFRGSGDKDFIKYLSNKIFGKEISLKKANPSTIKDQLIDFESQNLFKDFKIGVLYAKEKDTLESEIYSNTSGSSDFEEFLSVLGSKVVLKDRVGYMGGLDNKADRTGTHSIFTEYQDHNIMFHVSTLIPRSEGEQSVSLKRHIGNDVLVVIFKEGEEKINIAEFKSQFNHVFAIIRKVCVNNVYMYKLEIVMKPGVPPSPPFLPDPALFPIGEDFRTMFLTKLINLERMITLSVPIFRSKIKSVRQFQLYDIVANALASRKEKKDVKGTPQPRSTVEFNVQHLRKRTMSHRELIKKNSMDSLSKVKQDIHETQNRERSPSSSPILRKKSSKPSIVKENKTVIDIMDSKPKGKEVTLGRTKSSAELHKEHFNMVKSKWMSLSNASSNSPPPPPQRGKSFTKKSSKSSPLKGSTRRVVVVNADDPNHKDIIVVKVTDSLESFEKRIEKEMGRQLKHLEFSNVNLKTKHLILLKDCDIVTAYFRK